ncbi:MAG: carboxymuconolactone decarboxylase family protein [Acidiferrobacterales bacterium]
MKNGYHIYDETTAPLASSGLLNQVREHYGFIPNALGAMAASSKALEAYMMLDKMVRETSFSDIERNVVLLTVTREGDCSYCVAAHSAFAKMDRVPEEIIQSLRDNTPLSDARLEALHQFAARVVTRNGNLEEDEINRFLDAGFTREQALEVILIYANKVIAMQANRVMGTDLDPALAQTRWSRVA